MTNRAFSQYGKNFVGWKRTHLSRRSSTKARFAQKSIYFSFSISFLRSNFRNLVDLGCRVRSGFRFCSHRFAYYSCSLTDVQLSPRRRLDTPYFSTKISRLTDRLIASSAMGTSPGWGWRVRFVCGAVRCEIFARL
jgi:hypothetical protein